MIFFVLSILLLFLLITLIIKTYWPDKVKELGWRGLLIITTLIHGGVIIISTELLSFNRSLTSVTVLFFWIIWLFFLFICLIIIVYKKHYQINWKIIFNYFFSFNSIEIYYLLGLLFIFSCTLITAWFSVPNNMDAVSYHLSRIMYWIQNNTVAHFATSNLRQLYQMPGAEYINLHLFLLNNNDQWSNIPQYLAFIGCCIVGSFVVKILGGNKFSQWFTCILTATLPIAILQATSAKNDLIVAYWVILAIVFLLLAREKRWFGYSLFFSLAIALALVTKATATIYLAPFIIWFIIQESKYGLKWLMSNVICLLLVSFLLLSPAIIRNELTFGLIFGPSNGEFNQVDATNDSIGVKLTISNIIRNIALQFGNQNVHSIDAMAEVINWFHNKLGISTSDPRITYAGLTFGIPYGDYLRSEDMASNPFHTILIGLFCLIGLYFGRKSSDRIIWYYMGATALGFILFCGYLRWQPWHTRLHIPFFIIILPLIAVIINKIEKKWMALIITAALLFQAQPYLFHNLTRPLIGKDSVITLDRDTYYERMIPQYTIAMYARNVNCSNVGLIFGNDELEYVYWYLLNANAGVKISHINVNNVSSKYEKKYTNFNSPPCGIITTRDITKTNSIIYRNFEYKELASIYNYSFFWLEKNY